MLKHLKIFLLFFVSLCYSNTVFEFSDDEKMVNFENESHIYVQEQHQYDFVDAASEDTSHAEGIWHAPICFNFCFLDTIFSENKYLFYKKLFIPPSERLFLLNSSFLI